MTFTHFSNELLILRQLTLVGPHDGLPRRHAVLQPIWICADTASVVNQIRFIIPIFTTAQRLPGDRPEEKPHALRPSKQQACQAREVEGLRFFTANHS